MAREDPPPGYLNNNGDPITDPTTTPPPSTTTSPPLNVNTSGFIPTSNPKISGPPSEVVGATGYYQGPAYIPNDQGGVSVDVKPGDGNTGWITSALAQYAPKDDPNYWITKWNSGELGTDPGYVLARIKAVSTGGGGTTPAPVAATTPEAIPPNGNPAGYVTPTGGVSKGTDPYFTNLRNIIQSRLAFDQAPVDPNKDQNIVVPFNAAQDAASRQSDQERTALAEQLYAQGGLNTNAVNQGIQQSAERNATSLGTLRGTLVQQAYASKLQDMQTLLQMAITAGDTESQQQLSADIQNLQAMIQRENIGAGLAESAAGQNANTVKTAAGG